MFSCKINTKSTFLFCHALKTTKNFLHLIGRTSPYQEKNISPDLENSPNTVNFSRSAKSAVLTVKWEKTALEDDWWCHTWKGRGMWNSCEILLEWLSYGNCGIQVGKYLVQARLDYWTLSQDSRNTLSWHKSCSTFSLFTFHLENSTLSARVKPSLENNSSNLLISVAAVIKIIVYIYSIKFNFIKALFSVCILVYCSLPTTNWPHSGNQVACYHQNSPMMHCAEREK